MKNILKLRKHDAVKEIKFELKYLGSLSVRERFRMMINKSREMLELLESNGHRRPSKIIKRA
jgi:hypothetical protein